MKIGIFQSTIYYNLRLCSNLKGELFDTTPVIFIPKRKIYRHLHSSRTKKFNCFSHFSITDLPELPFLTNFQSG